MANYRRLRPEVPSPDACTVYGQLCVWARDTATPQVSYLGYPLLLSPAERRLLLCLLRAVETGQVAASVETLSAALCEAEGPMPAASDTDADPFPWCAEDVDEVGPDDAPESVGRETVPDASEVLIYVKRINRKAREIGGRYLIIRDRHKGYRLNPRM